jgi:hypothetical protein
VAAGIFGITIPYQDYKACLTFVFSHALCLPPQLQAHPSPYSFSFVSVSSLPQDLCTYRYLLLEHLSLDLRTPDSDFLNPLPSHRGPPRHLNSSGHSSLLIVLSGPDPLPLSPDFLESKFAGEISIDN